MPVDMTADHEVGLDNYVVAGKPFTWSAFTFKQMVPQKVSWVIMRQNHDANAIIQGAQRSSPLLLLSRWFPRRSRGLSCAKIMIMMRMRSFRVLKGRGMGMLFSVLYPNCVVASAFGHALGYIVFLERFYVIGRLFSCISPPNAFWPVISQHMFHN